MSRESLAEGDGRECAQRIGVEVVVAL
jgi:hypothetical protein